MSEKKIKTIFIDSLNFTRLLDQINCDFFTKEGAHQKCLDLDVLRAPIVESRQRWNSFGARATSGGVVRRSIKKLPYV